MPRVPTVRFALIVAVVTGALFLGAGCTGGDAGPDAPSSGPNVILVTLDGLRWEEVFTGADDWLLSSKWTGSEEALRAEFWDADPDVRRQKLMPFLWSTVAGEGQVYGNRLRGSLADVTNTRVFSYPGYNEILTGFADSLIDSNDKIPNANTTVLEWVNRQPGFEGRVAAFGSWDGFPYIINEERSGVPVNAGFEPADPPMSDREAFLNTLQAQTPSPWGTVRLDVFTHHYAMEKMERDAPRLLYIAYGETDDFAHDGSYDHYVHAAHRTDAFLADLWARVQAHPAYAGNTTLILVTDHGRGAEDRWIGHGGDWVGSEHIWMAAIGPHTPVLGEVAEGQVTQSQIAATVAAALGLDYSNERPIGAPVAAMLGN